MAPDNTQNRPVRTLHKYVATERLRGLIASAFKEDFGPGKRDITTESLVDPSRIGEARVRVRKPGMLAGVALLPEIIAVYGGGIEVEVLKADGDRVVPDDEVARLRGPVRDILMAERTVLNFLCHLSGVATLTNQYVDAIKGTQAAVTDTRKTLPGLRGLQRYAVACGGGVNHRSGLYDAVLIKDNHLAGLPAGALGDALAESIAAARALTPPPLFIEIEVDTFDQLAEVLTAGATAGWPDIVLLDNMDTQQLRRCVAERDRLAPNVLLEASGGVTLANVRAVADTGVDRIAIGALTHSAPALDLGMDLEQAG